VGVGRSIDLGRAWAGIPLVMLGSFDCWPELPASQVQAGPGRTGAGHAFGVAMRQGSTKRGDLGHAGSCGAGTNCRLTFGSQCSEWVHSRKDGTQSSKYPAHLRVHSQKRMPRSHCRRRQCVQGWCCRLGDLRFLCNVYKHWTKQCKQMRTCKTCTHMHTN